METVDKDIIHAWVEFIKNYKPAPVAQTAKIEEITEVVKDEQDDALDNIELANIEDVITEPVTNTIDETELIGENSESKQPSDGFFNIIQAGQMITAHYKRQFPELKFVPPMNLVDGCVCDFMEGNDVIATAKMRFRNRIHLSPETGDMVLMVQLSDLAYSRGEVKIILTD